VTVVRDKKEEGHAVLTVTTDRGDYVLDNQTDGHPALVQDWLSFRQAPIAV
jgi:predicted transglutaminase-like cysteine proteinase